MNYQSEVAKKGLDPLGWQALVRRCHAVENLSRGRLFLVISKPGREYHVHIHQVYLNERFSNLACIDNRRAVSRYLDGIRRGIELERTLTGVYSAQQRKLV